VRSALPNQNPSVPPPRERTNDDNLATYRLARRQPFCDVSPPRVEPRATLPPTVVSFLVGIYLEQDDYLAVADGWGTVCSSTLRGTRSGIPCYRFVSLEPCVAGWVPFGT
jgi:hypothetical protein